MEEKVCQLIDELNNTKDKNERLTKFNENSKKREEQLKAQ